MKKKGRKEPPRGNKLSRTTVGWGRGQGVGDDTANMKSVGKKKSAHRGNVCEKGEGGKGEQCRLPSFGDGSHRKRGERKEGKVF